MLPIVAIVVLRQEPAAVWLAQTDAANPVGWLQSLGPFAAALAIGWFLHRERVRDLKEDRDHCRQQLEQRTAADVENRDTFLQAVRTIEAATAAMSATASALHRVETRLRAIERDSRTR